jgi:hypothetical protein
LRAALYEDTLNFRCCDKYLSLAGNCSKSYKTYHAKNGCTQSGGVDEKVDNAGRLMILFLILSKFAHIKAAYSQVPLSKRVDIDGQNDRKPLS